MSLAKQTWIIAILAVATQLPLAGQTEKRGELDEDVQITSSQAPTGQSPGGDVIYRITNLYSSPLVAVSFATQCGPKRGGRGSSDAALSHAIPLAHGQSRYLDKDPPDCEFKLTAAIFADGRQDGAEEELQRFVRRRRYAVAQLEPIADLAGQAYALEVAHGHGFDPSAISTVIEDRRAKLVNPTNGDFEEVGSERQVLDQLRDYTRQLDILKGEPDYADLKRAYVGILQEWLRSLQAAPYPVRPQMLRIPR